MKDPRKVLKNWMEHHGYDMEFTFEEQSISREKSYTARIELPIDTGYGNCKIISLFFILFSFYNCFFFLLKNNNDCLYRCYWDF